MITGVHHTCLIVSDIEESTGFLKEVLGARLLFSDEASGDSFSRGVGVENATAKLAIFKVGSATVELIEYLNPRSKPEGLRTCDIGTFHLAFEVDDIDKTMEELEKKSIKFNSPANVPGGEFEGWRWVYFTGPDGHQFELVESPNPKDPLR